MNRNVIETTAREYIARHLNCKVEDFQKAYPVFVANDDEAYPFFEICTMGASAIVSASGGLVAKLKKLLENKNRDEIFECPFVYGQSIFYIPDTKRLHRYPLDTEYNYELLQGEEIRKLKGISGFENSLTLDEKGIPSACIVFCAVKNSEVVALAGASKESDAMWEIGIDVVPEYRNRGLAVSLVSNLACTILEKGIVPFYCASTTNIGSQAVASRSGFVPCWVSTYGNIWDGNYAYHEIMKGLSLE